MQNFVIQSIIAGSAQLGNFGFNLDQSLVGGSSFWGSQKVGVILDCSDPLIYDLPTQKLTIPFGYRDFCGVFNLSNANGLTIAKIVNAPPFSDFRIQQDSTGAGAGTVNFVKTPVGVAIVEEIIGDSTIAPLFSITWRSSGQDFIDFKRDLDLNGVINLVNYT